MINTNKSVQWFTWTTKSIMQWTVYISALSSVFDSLDTSTACSWAIHRSRYKMGTEATGHLIGCSCFPLFWRLGFGNCVIKVKGFPVPCVCVCSAKSLFRANVSKVVNYTRKREREAEIFFILFLLRQIRMRQSNFCYGNTDFCYWKMRDMTCMQMNKTFRESLLQNICVRGWNINEWKLSTSVVFWIDIETSTRAF